MISKNLVKEIENAGYKMKVFKAQHLEKISTEIKGLVEKGLLNEGFYNDNLANFNYDYNSVLNNAKSVMMVAIPQGKSIAEFVYEGDTLEAIIPPTYVYPAVSIKLANILDQVLTANGFGWARPPLPLKLLAVRSGLGKYGRNNICYIPDAGSFARLAAYITDYEFDEDNWGESTVMDSCNTCKACVDNCPTGAILKDRFLIQAENCLTNFNEYEPPIPRWIQPNWHDSIVGCMKCQTVCPHNRNLVDDIEERICFDEEETRLILAKTIFEDLPEATQGKISYAGMENYYTVLSRNINLLLENK